MTTKKVIQSQDGFGFSNIQLSDNYNKFLNDRFGNDEHYPVACIENERSRVNLIDPNYNYKDVKLISQNISSNNNVNLDENYIYWSAININEERNNVMAVFFSKKNVDHIQLLLIKMVKFITNENISPQDVNQILLVMRNKYMNANADGNVKGEQLLNVVRALNKDVLDALVPHLITQMKQFLSYRRDHGMDPKVIEQPKYTNQKGLIKNKGFDFRL